MIPTIVMNDRHEILEPLRDYPDAESHLQLKARVTYRNKQGWFKPYKVVDREIVIDTSDKRVQRFCQVRVRRCLSEQGKARVGFCVSGAALMAIYLYQVIATTGTVPDSAWRACMFFSIFIAALALLSMVFEHWFRRSGFKAISAMSTQSRCDNANRQDSDDTAVANNPSLAFNRPEPEARA